MFTTDSAYLISWHTSSTIPLPPREQLCNSYCSNKQQLMDLKKGACLHEGAESIIRNVTQTARQGAQHLGRTSWFAQSFGGCRCTAQCSGSHPALSAHPAACGNAFSKICITASLDLVHAAKCRAVPPPLFRTLAASGYACIRLRTLLLDLEKRVRRG
jgi:hypothetical protein